LNFIECFFRHTFFQLLARAGRSGVAVSLVGEQDRKLMKQVAKSAKLPVKARLIPPGNVVQSFYSGLISGKFSRLI